MSLNDKIIELISAEYVKDYQLQMRFSDGVERTIDFEPFLRASAHPQIRSYLEVEKFKQFTLAYGDLVWHDYELCFPIADLYEDTIGLGEVVIPEELAHTAVWSVYVDGQQRIALPLPLKEWLHLQAGMSLLVEEEPKGQVFLRVQR